MRAKSKGKTLYGRTLHTVMRKLQKETKLTIYYLLQLGKIQQKALVVPAGFRHQRVPELGRFQPQPGRVRAQGFGRVHGHRGLSQVDDLRPGTLFQRRRQERPILNRHLHIFFMLSTIEKTRNSREVRI